MYSIVKFKLYFKAKKQMLVKNVYLTKLLTNLGKLNNN